MVSWNCIRVATTAPITMITDLRVSQQGKFVVYAGLDICSWVYVWMCVCVCVCLWVLFCVFLVVAVTVLY